MNVKLKVNKKEGLNPECLVSEGARPAHRTVWDPKQLGEQAVPGADSLISARVLDQCSF